jgi:hypothetical protein
MQENFPHTDCLKCCVYKAMLATEIFHLHSIFFCKVLQRNQRVCHLWMLVFRVVILCGLVGRYQDFGGTLVSNYKSMCHYNLEYQYQHLHHDSLNWHDTSYNKDIHDKVSICMRHCIQTHGKCMKNRNIHNFI